MASIDNIFWSRLQLLKMLEDNRRDAEYEITNLLQEKDRVLTDIGELYWLPYGDTEELYLRGESEEGFLSMLSDDVIFTLLRFFLGE